MHLPMKMFHSTQEGGLHIIQYRVKKEYQWHRPSLLFKNPLIIIIFAHMTILQNIGIMWRLSALAVTKSQEYILPSLE